MASEVRSLSTTFSNGGWEVAGLKGGLGNRTHTFVSPGQLPESFFSPYPFKYNTFLNPAWEGLPGTDDVWKTAPSASQQAYYLVN